MKINNMPTTAGTRPELTTSAEQAGLMKREIAKQNASPLTEKRPAENMPTEQTLTRADYQRENLLRKSQRSATPQTSGLQMASANKASIPEGLAQKSAFNNQPAAQASQEELKYAKTQSKTLYLIKGQDAKGNTVEAVTDDKSAYSKYAKDNQPLSQGEFQKLSRSNNIITSATDGKGLNIEAPAGYVQVNASPNDKFQSPLNIKSVKGTNLDVLAKQTDVNVDVKGTTERDIVTVETRGKAKVDTVSGQDHVAIRHSSDAKINAGDGVNFIDARYNDNLNIQTGTSIDTIKTHDNKNATINTSRKGFATIDASRNEKLNITTGQYGDDISVRDNKFVNINAGDGDNKITAEGYEEASIRTGRGKDHINAYSTGKATVISGGESDYIRTGSGSDTISAGSGKDVVYSGGGDDRILAGEGDDYVDGGKGNDRIRGGSGNDILSGNAGNDVMTGDLDNDVLIAGPGQDKLYGRDGSDIAYAQKGDTVKTTERTEISDISETFDPETDLKRIRTSGSEDFRNRVNDDLVTLQSIPVSAKGLEHIEKAKSGNGETGLNITISETTEETGNAARQASFVPWRMRFEDDALLTNKDSNGDGILDAGKGSPSKIGYNPSYSHVYNSTNGKGENETNQPLSILYHELGHGYSMVTGTLDLSRYTGTGETGMVPEHKQVKNQLHNNVRNEERKVVGLDIQDGNRTKHDHPSELTENALLEAINRPTRKSYTY